MEEAYFQSYTESNLFEDVDQTFDLPAKLLQFDHKVDDLSDFYASKTVLRTSTIDTQSSNSVQEEFEVSYEANDCLSAEFTRLAQLHFNLEIKMRDFESLGKGLLEEKAKMELEKKLLLDFKTELIEALAANE